MLEEQLKQSLESDFGPVEEVLLLTSCLDGATRQRQAYVLFEEHEARVSLALEGRSTHAQTGFSHFYREQPQTGSDTLFSAWRGIPSDPKYYLRKSESKIIFGNVRNLECMSLKSTFFQVWTAQNSFIIG